MDTLAHFAPVIGLLFFFSFFVVTAVWLMLPETKKRMRQHALIPLMENEHDRA